MKENKLPPYIILKSTKEVIFYLSKDDANKVNLVNLMEKMKLTDYKGMIINSKCIFKKFYEENISN
tara:strand:- start:581 stop:778 length:198 start_codon:yes stop_codon:yes gene_type:complete